VKVVDVAHLAGPIRWTMSERGVEDGLRKGQRTSRARKVRILQGSLRADNNNI
jgi:hypothetical protein